ncbi:MAG: efflux RND transporter periplasmic adaptor subunit [Byssovorax sp.]
MGNPLSQDLASLKIQRDVDPDRKGPGRFILAAVLVAGAAAAGVVTYPRLKGEVFKTEIGMTEIALISPAQSSITVTSTGYVVPQIVARPGAKIPGRISRITIKEGSVVKTGDVLADLEDADQKSQIAWADARAAAALARAEASRANIAELTQQIGREKELVEKGVNGGANLGDMILRQKALEQSARAGDAEVRAAQSEVTSLRVLLKDRTIVAPIDGTVLTKPPEVGELVGPQAPLVEIADFRSLVVETDVPEARLNLVKIGAPCEIVLDAYPSKRYRGSAVELGKRVNRAKATIVVKVKFLDAMENVLPEMAARVSFLAQELTVEAMKEPPKQVVPASAIAERGGEKVVFVVDQDKVRMVPITVGAAMGSGFELTSGPPPGTKLVSQPAKELSDGQKVKEKEKE